LHGQLGSLPNLPNSNDIVSYRGGDDNAPTASDYIVAAKAIPRDKTTPSFMPARRLNSKAGRVIFLGFGYTENYVERLQLKT
jgi:hypothetical protein